MKYFLILLFLLISCKNELNYGKIRFAVEGTVPPYSYMENGELKGFDIDLGNKIAESINKKAEYRIIQWSDAIAGLHSGAIDAVPSIDETEDRRDNIDFSIPYFYDYIAVVFLKDNPIFYKSDLNNKKIAVLLGEILENFAKEKYKNAKIISTNSDVLSLELLKAKYVDVVLLTEFQAKRFVESNNCCSYKIIQQYEKGVVLGARKNYPFLVEINQALDNLKKNGVIKELEAKWFGEINQSERNFLK